MNDVERRRLLRGGLIGDRENLWHTSVSFHSAIEHLVALLPSMIEGIAAQAQVDDERRAVQIYDREHLVPEPIHLDPDDVMWIP